jgi:hypothetical protein
VTKPFFSFFFSFSFPFVSFLQLTPNARKNSTKTGNPMNQNGIQYQRKPGWSQQRPRELSSRSLTLTTDTGYYTPHHWHRGIPVAWQDGVSRSVRKGDSTACWRMGKETRIFDFLDFLSPSLFVPRFHLRFVLVLVLLPFFLLSFPLLLPFICVFAGTCLNPKKIS